MTSSNTRIHINTILKPTKQHKKDISSNDINDDDFYQCKNIVMNSIDTKYKLTLKQNFSRNLKTGLMKETYQQMFDRLHSKRSNEKHINLDRFSSEGKIPIYNISEKIFKDQLDDKDSINTKKPLHNLTFYKNYRFSIDDTKRNDKIDEILYEYDNKFRSKIHKIVNNLSHSIDSHDHDYINNHKDAIVKANEYSNNNLHEAADAPKDKQSNELKEQDEDKAEKEKDSITQLKVKKLTAKNKINTNKLSFKKLNVVSKNEKNESDRERVDRPNKERQLSQTSHMFYKPNKMNNENNLFSKGIGQQNVKNKLSNIN